MRNLIPHQNVVLFLGVCTQPVCLVTKFYENGSLNHYMQKKQLSPKMRFKIIQGVTAGMLHLEMSKIVHRDLAARNVLIGANMEAVVSDFGFARAIGNQEDASTTTTHIGPIRWMAPECLKASMYSIKSDIWAWGITIWEILSGGNYPFKGLNNTLVIIEITSGNTPSHLQFPDSAPREIISLVRQCWQMKPMDRPSSFQEIYSRLELLKNVM